MNKTATEVMQDAIFASVCDAIQAFKSNSGGVQNALLRDLSAVHVNTAFEDVPEAIQIAIRKSTQEALQRLNKEGYAVSGKGPPAPRPTRAVAAPRGFRGGNSRG